MIESQFEDIHVNRAWLQIMDYSALLFTTDTYYLFLFFTAPVSRLNIDQY